MGQGIQELVCQQDEGLLRDCLQTIVPRRRLDPLRLFGPQPRRCLDQVHPHGVRKCRRGLLDRPECIGHQRASAWSGLDEQNGVRTADLLPCHGGP